VALLFGSERFGLSNEDLSHCHWLLRIPTREEHISMNLGQAVAVCLYEFIRNAKTPVQSSRKDVASSAEVERISSLLFDSLNASGYVKPRTVVKTHEMVRRLVRRQDMSAGDAKMWMGMLRQILWKVNNQG
jgi:tRNA/rRNA methyltransferase